MSPDLQRSWLDRSGGPEAAELAGRTAELYEAYAGFAARLERALGDDRLRQERIDLLQFQIGEIEAARLGAGEEDELRRERELLRHAEAIRHALGASFGLLFEDEGAARRPDLGRRPRARADRGVGFPSGGLGPRTSGSPDRARGDHCGATAEPRPGRE